MTIEEQIVAFGKFRFDHRTLELFQGEEPIPLPKRPASLLALLLKNANSLVTREEIQKACWAETPFGADAAINAAVRQLRRALGESATSARFIKTHVGRGYSFVLSETDRSSPRPWLRTVAAVVLASGLVGALGLLVSMEEAPHQLPPEIRLELDMADHLLVAGSATDRVEVIKQLENLVAANPLVARGHALLSRAHFAAGRFDAAQVAADRALKVDPDSVEARQALGMLALAVDRDLLAASEHIAIATAHAPNDLENQVAMAFVLALQGKSTQAIEILDLVYERQPFEAGVGEDAGWVYYLSGEFEKAAELCDAAAVVNPRAVWAADCAVLALQRKGKSAEALNQVYRSLSHWGHAASVVPLNENDSAKAQLTEYWKWRARRSEERGASGASDHLAMLYVQAGRPRDALKALEKSLSETSMATLSIPTNPTFEVLHSDASFQALVAALRESPRTRPGDTDHSS